MNGIDPKSNSSIRSAYEKSSDNDAIVKATLLESLYTPNYSRNEFCRWDATTIRTGPEKENGNGETTKYTPATHLVQTCVTYEVSTGTTLERRQPQALKTLYKRRILGKSLRILCDGTLDNKKYPRGIRNPG